MIINEKPFMLGYYQKLIGLELPLPEGFEPLTEEEIDTYLKTFVMPIKKKLI